MLKKCLVLMLFGKPVPWLDQYRANIATLKKYGWEWLILHDREWFLDKVFLKLGVHGAKLDPDSTKYWDYRPMLGEILKEELKGYDFWGHTDHDVVYGRLDKWVTDDLLNSTDVFSNDPSAMCGFFSLYRNTQVCNLLYKMIRNWEDSLRTDEVFVHDEHAMTTLMNDLRRGNDPVRWIDRFWQGNDKHGVGEVKLLLDGTLMHNGQEIMAYHFKETKKWPLA